MALQTACLVMFCVTGLFWLISAAVIYVSRKKLTNVPQREWAALLTDDGTENASSVPALNDGPNSIEPEDLPAMAGNKNLIVFVLIACMSVAYGIFAFNANPFGGWTVFNIFVWVYLGMSAVDLVIVLLGYVFNIYFGHGLREEEGDRVQEKTALFSIYLQSIVSTVLRSSMESLIVACAFIVFLL